MKPHPSLFFPALCLALLILLPGISRAEKFLVPFTSDGCSSFPDGPPQEPERRRECCIRDDRVYWLGGTYAEHLKADPELQECIAAVENPLLAETIWQGCEPGFVKHPADWAPGGYHEIQGNRPRNLIIDPNPLMEALELSSVEALQTADGAWIEEAHKVDAHWREEACSQSVAVGSVEFVRKPQAALGHRGRKRDIAESEDAYMLRETE